LTYHQIAARLTVDAEELRLFVDAHPNPTAPIVLGWAKASPEHREVVEEWLTARLQRRRDRADRLDEIIENSNKHDDARYAWTRAGRGQ
jgi:hypothetical protein